MSTCLEEEYPHGWEIEFSWNPEHVRKKFNKKSKTHKDGKRTLTMRRSLTMIIVLETAVVVVLIAINAYLRIMYLSVFMILLGLLYWAGVFYTVMLADKYYQVGEKLFTQRFGVKPDKTEMTSRRLSRYDQLEEGTSGKAVWMKFWLKGEFYKGIVDIQNEALYMKTPTALPAYPGVLIPVWKETVETYRSRTPKRVEYRDRKDLPHRVDYLDRKGNLTGDSWRRREGAEEYWNPKKRIYERLTL